MSVMDVRLLDEGLHDVIARVADLGDLGQRHWVAFAARVWKALLEGRCPHRFPQEPGHVRR